MAVLDERGYLETPYLARRYLSSEIDFGVGMQVRPFVSQPNGMEVKVSYPQHITHGSYLSTFGYLTKPYLAEQVCALQGIQAQLGVLGPDKTGMQVSLTKFTDTKTGMEVKVSYPQHLLCGGYLTGNGYLNSEPYLAAKICALQGMQTEMFIARPEDDEFTGMQVDRKIFTDDSIGMQVLARIFTDDRTGMEVTLLRAEPTSMQTSMVLYNTTQLRFLCDFSSRGLVSNNWTSPQGTAPGDFGLSNLNTDVLEQRAQSPNGIIALWELRCDTGIPNTFVDTIAILNHNLTSSAIVSVQGSDDVNFLSVKFNYNMVTETTNMYYIAPTLPTIASRYVRFIIQDPTNTENALKIGAIIFGSAVIMTRRTCFENPVGFGLKHFKDTLTTEGFTSVMNDRALRKVLSLEFKNLRVDGGDYLRFQSYFKTAKTDLKCLVIPKPDRPSSLAVFSKLVELPLERHMANTEDDWRIEFDIDYDESL